MEPMTFDDVVGAPAPAAGSTPALVAPAAPAASGFAPMTFDDITGASPTASAAPLTIPGPANAAASPTDPVANPDGDGLSQDQIDDAVRARFAKAGAQGRQNLADLPENAAHVVAAAGGAVPVLGAGVNQAAAALATPFTISDYAGNLDAANRMDADFDAQHPVAAGAAKTVGAGAGTMGMLPEAGLGLGAGSLLARAGTAAAAQGALGGADAAVRGQNAGYGAALGAAGGGAGPVAGAAVGSAIRGVTGLMQGVPADLQGFSRATRAWLADGMADVSPADAAAARNATGPDGMLAEMSPRMLDYAKSIADQNGAGKPIVRDAFQERMDGRNARVGALVDGALGPAQSPIQFTGQLDQQARPLAQAQADAIRSAGPVDVSDTFKSLQAALPNTAPGSPEHGAYGQAVTMLSEKPQPVATGSTWEPDPVGSGQAPAMPANLPEPPPYSDTPAPTRPVPVGVPRPQDLHSFIRSLGGMQDPGGDLASMGLNSLIARPGQGLGPDAVRQVAAEAGYLGGDTAGAMRNSTIGDLHNALENGDRTFSVYDDDAVHQWAARDAAQAQYQQYGGANADPTARAAGPRPVAPGFADPGGGFDPNSPTGLMTSPVPTTNAAKILSARRAIDDRINYSGPTSEAPSSALRSQQGAYQQARAGLSDALHQQVPGYSEPTAALAGIARQRDALNDGLGALGSGATATRPDDFAAAWTGLSPEEQAAFRIGMRANVDQALGTRPNDFSALKAVTQGENGWNGQKLGTAFGTDAIGAVNTGIDRETQMARNSNHVIGGSPTNENQQIRRLTSPEGMSNLGTGLANWGDQFAWGKPASWVPPAFQPRTAYNTMMEGAAERARTEMAPLLIQKGPEADGLMRALLLQAQRKAALAPPNTDPLVQALAASRQVAQQRALGQ